MDDPNSIAILGFYPPTKTIHRPWESSKPILAPNYELRPQLIAMIQSQPFLGKKDKNPYLQIQEFELTCDCLRIEGMSDETLRWKLFPFPLKGRAKQWYARTIGKKQGDWGSLRSTFCIDFYPISKVADLRVEVLTFKQKENESLASS
jgi:hypothetical protein